MSDTSPKITIFEPITLGPIRLRNRIVMAPMTRNRADTRDAPWSLNVEYYAQRASAGLIVTEASQISPQGKGYPGTPGIYSEQQIAGWRRITEAVHRRGGRIFLQLWHVGRISHPSLQPGGGLPVAPSPVRPAGQAMAAEGTQDFVTPRALGIDEIAGIVADFGRAALNARRAGFDGVELHAANGYLLDQFLRDSTNRRSDRYGGSIENRMRLLLEVVDGIAEVWDPARLGVRLSPTSTFNDIRDSNPQLSFGFAAAELGRRKLAYLHLSQTGDDGSFDWATLRRVFAGRVILNGGYDPTRAQAAVAGSAADMIAFGVPFIANPDLVERIRRGKALGLANRATFYGGDHRGYTDYPSLDVTILESDSRAANDRTRSSGLAS
jgi:N-ethylmaleimide reductase